MTYEELKKKFAMHKPRSDEEHRLQAACVHWFRFAHSQLAPYLFAIPNGGARDVITGARLKAEGVLPGVADLMLAVPNKKYHGLFVEMKTDTGRQQKSQRDFQYAILRKGYHYEICRSKQEFIHTIETYLNDVSKYRLD